MIACRRYFAFSRLTTNKPSRQPISSPNKGPGRCGVVEDTNNPTYSQYLARTFLDKAYDTPPLKVVLRSNNLNLPPYAVDKLGIDWVFFAGDWKNALVLIRQLQAMPGIKKAKVLLSDASAD